MGSAVTPALDEVYAEALGHGVRIERPPFLRLIRLTGPQRIWFLQNTVTADVEGIELGHFRWSCFLDAKGRVQAHFRVGVVKDAVWLDAEADTGPALVEWFTKYRFRTKVEIEPRPARTVTVVGPAASSLALPGTVVERDGCIVFGDTLGDLFLADVHADDVPSGVASLLPAPPALYDLLRIQAGIGAFGVDYGQRDLPQEAGLSRELSVDKGCYVGQETVARIHFRGHVNRVLRPLRFEGGGDATGCQLTWGGRVVGRVTSWAFSARSGAVGIGMLRVEVPEGASLDVEGGGKATAGPIPEGTKIKTPTEASS